MQPRSRLELCRDILAVCDQGPTRKTSLVYQTGQNFRQATKYINMLIEKGFLRQDGIFFSITDKGRDLLGKLRRISK